jgi:hypothetical protein
MGGLSVFSQTELVEQIPEARVAQALAESQKGEKRVRDEAVSSDPRPEVHRGERAKRTKDRFLGEIPHKSAKYSLAVLLVGSLGFNALLLSLGGFRSSKPPVEIRDGTQKPTDAPNNPQAPKITGEAKKPQAPKIIGEAKKPEDAEKRAINAVVDMTLRTQPVALREKLFRVVLYLREKGKTEARPFNVGFVAARTHDEARSIASRSTGIPRDTIDIVEGRVFDDACFYNKKTIGQSILHDNGVNNLGTENGRAFFDLVIRKLYEVLNEQEYFDSMPKDLKGVGK